MALVLAHAIKFVVGCYMLYAIIPGGEGSEVKTSMVDILTYKWQKSTRHNPSFCMFSFVYL